MEHTHKWDTKEQLKNYWAEIRTQVLAVQPIFFLLYYADSWSVKIIYFYSQ